MLTRVQALEVIRPAKSGRTRPIIMSCESGTTEPLEVFCKISDHCEEGVVALAREVVAACVADWLHLPVPTPYLVELPSKLASAVADSCIARRIRASSTVAFGSTRVPNQFSLWFSERRIPPRMRSVALGAFVFDAVIENFDRRTRNPNCLVAGDDIRLIDHELAFPTVVIGASGPPWKLGAMQWMKGKGNHIFYSGLSKRPQHLDFGRLRGLWLGLSDSRLEECRLAIPHEWDESLNAVDRALDRIQNARENIDDVIAEVQRVLQ